MPTANCFAQLAGLLVVSITLSSAAAADSVEGFTFFEQRIRPVLVKHCYECHAAGSEELKGGLAVDSHAGLLRGGDSGPAIVKGKPEESVLIEAMKYEGSEMPPSGKLPQNVIGDFEKWVRMGAPDPRTAPAESVTRRTIDIEKGREFWSFQSVEKPAVPVTGNSDWPHSDIDHFIHRRLTEKQVAPPADADRATLVRRLWFDLIGLPPTVEELETVLEDNSEQWLEHAVDRLLESPHFGEHWGRHWLDVARYADSNGSDFNATFHNAWRYRDYVLKSFQNDKPYDQFIREQIAGDLLPSGTRDEKTDQIVATGFLMLGTKMLSERDKLKLTMDVVDEQIDTVGKAFLGMTLGCARCHDHKFDPIPTADYYALAGVFRSTRVLQGESQQYVSTWPKTTLPASPERIAEVENHQKQTAMAKKAIATLKKELKAAETLVASLSSGQNDLLADDETAKKIGTWKPSTFISPFVGKGYIHDDLKKSGDRSVIFTLTPPADGAYKLQLSYTTGSTREKRVPVSFQQGEQTQSFTVDQTRKPKIDNSFAEIATLMLVAKQPVTVTISNKGTTGHVIADAVRLVPEVPLSEGSEQAENVVELAKAKDALQQKRDELKSSEAALKSLGSNGPAPLPQAFAVAEGKEPGDCAICIRGEHLNTGKKVPRGFLQVASNKPVTIPESESGRLQLAEWIASAENPLTGRVMVNRVWYHLMGEGLVRSVDNFGTLGERPTHPELLDYLTARFTDASDWNWSVKTLIREIVLSRTWRATSEHREAAWQIDPENRLLWKANRKRLPAEAIRDSLLMLSGDLDREPDNSSPVKGFGTLVSNNNGGASSKAKVTPRRSVYLAVIRNDLLPLLMVFDFADPDLVVGKRPVTNVPTQALLLMNSPFVKDSAAQIAKRLNPDAGLITDAELTNLYRTVLCREPSQTERQRNREWIDKANGEGSPFTEHDQYVRLIHAILASTEFRMLD